MQSQPEGSCLRFPEHISPQRDVPYEMAVSMLLKGAGMATNVPFSWSYIDKPNDATVVLLFLPSSTPFPNDGIRWQDHEIKGNMAAGGNRELEVHEIKFGFIPGAGEQAASRVRRRFRLTKGGNPDLLLVHYTRGPSTMIQPQLQNQPVRAYPLRPINEPSVFVAGEKRGIKVPVGGGPGPSSGGMGSGPSGMGGGMPPPGMGMGGAGGPGGGLPPNMSMQQQQALIAQQNSRLEALERRDRERQAAAMAAQAQGRHPHPRVEEDDSGDEIEQVSTRSLALARYKRNHDWMNDVFHQAAFGRVIPVHEIAGHPDSQKGYSTLFNKNELDGQISKLQEEVARLQDDAEKRRVEKIRKIQTEEGAAMLGTSSGAEIVV